MHTGTWVDHPPYVSTFDNKANWGTWDTEHRIKPWRRSWYDQPSIWTWAW